MMHKKLYILGIILLFTTIKCLAQSETKQYFYVFVQEDETNWWCSTDFKYETLLLQTDNYKARNIISKNKMNELKTNEKYSIRSYDFTLTNKDHIVIYEQIISQVKSTNCKGNSKTIKAFKTRDSTNIDAILEEKINTSFTKDRTISYKIIEILTPYVNENNEGDLFEELLGNIRMLILEYADKKKKLTKEEQEKIINEIKKSSYVGVRG